MKDNKLLVCGDSSIEINKLVLSGCKVDVIVTDPPYGVNFKSHYDDSKKYVFSKIDVWYKGFYDILKDDRHMFVFVPIKEIHKWIESGIKAGFNFKNIISSKAHFIGGTYKPKNGFSYEFQPILHFTKGKGRDLFKYDFVKTSDSWYNDKRNTNPNRYTYTYSNYIGKELSFANTKSTVKNSKETSRHPNEKNVKLIKFLIGVSTLENDVVFDPFMGCGTTGVASTELKRKFIGIELDESFFNVCVDKIGK